MDIRPLPGMTLNELNGLLNDALAPVSERWPGRLTVDELHPPIPGYECPPNHQLVEVVEKLLGAKTEVVNYCTEAPFIQTLCPTLVLGLAQLIRLINLMNIWKHGLSSPPAN
ncbi:acetylornithine deacetylase [Escherichia coli]|nr:acetylornithine deacetylase [Escherichia coli]